MNQLVIFEVKNEENVTTSSELTNRIIFFSGGKSSFSVAAYVKEKYPEDNILLYFTDTLWENKDLYRFIYEASDKLELPLLIHADGRNPMQLMFDEKLVFNSRLGLCSKKLKVEVSDNYIRRGIKPKIEKWHNRHFLKNDYVRANPVLYFGIGFDEMHRQDAIVHNWQPYQVEMPLIDHIIDNNEMLKKYDIEEPYLYKLGFTHNNCNARCVKAGQAHYKRLKDMMPDEFKKLKEQEWHMKTYVSSYHYIKGMKKLEECQEDPMIDDFIERELAELDDKFKDYFDGKADKPKPHFHPAITGSGDNMDYLFQRFSFMKRQQNNQVSPYMLRDLEVDILKDEEEKRKAGTQLDLFDFGGCGCFVDYGSCEIEIEEREKQAI